MALALSALAGAFAPPGVLRRLPRSPAQLLRALLAVVWPMQVSCADMLWVRSQRLHRVETWPRAMWIARSAWLTCVLLLDVLCAGHAGGDVAADLQPL
jgi:hypothetical protein